jgi:hypothetical protein
MRDPRRAELGEQRPQRGGELVEDTSVGVVLGSHSGAQVIRRTSAPEREAAVRGALPVDEEPAAVGERLACCKPGVVPKRLGQRFGRDHERVHRHERAPHPRQLSGERFGRADDDLGADRSATRPYRAAFDRVHRCVLVDARALLLDNGGETMRKLGGMDGRAVGRVQRAEIGLAADSGTSFVGRQPPEIVLTEAPRPVVGELTLEAIAVRGQRRDLERSAASPVAVDAFLGDDALDLSHGREHRALHRDRAVAALARGELFTGRRKEARAPTAVPTRCAEAHMRGFAHHDPQCRIDTQERVRGPQAGEARADDHNIGIGVTRQRRARRGSVCARVPPEAHHARQYAPPHDPVRSA